MSKSKDKSKKTAFDAPRTSAFNPLPEEVTLVLDQEDTAHEGRYAHLYDPRALDEAEGAPGREELVRLAESMRAVGFFGALPVDKDAETGHIIAMAGRRRIRAARLANQWIREELRAAGITREEEIVDRLIRVTVLRVPRGFSAEMATEVMIAENSLRMDPTPLEKAEAASRWIARGGKMVVVARAFGESRTNLDALLKLNELAPEVKKAVREGLVAWTAAVGLHGKAPEEQASVVEGLTAGGTRKARTRQVRAAAGKSVAPTKKAVVGVLAVAQEVFDWDNGQPGRTPVDLRQRADALSDAVPGLKLQRPGSPTEADRARIEGLLLGIRYARGLQDQDQDQDQ